MKLSDLQKKLIVLAFDRGAAANEGENALQKLLDSWKKEYGDGHELVKALLVGNGASPSPRPIGGLTMDRSS
jgi:hypothetical protein